MPSLSRKDYQHSPRILQLCVLLGAARARVSRNHSLFAKSMESPYPHPRSTGLSPILMVLLLMAATPSVTQMTTDWQQRVREQVLHQELDAALAIVDQRIADSAADLEAHGWRGRILAWKGRWSEAESEYREVLDKVPGDTEILTALADVLLWQGRPKEALQYLDRAERLSPSNPDLFTRRARVLAILGRPEEPRAEPQGRSQVEPQNQAVKKTLNVLAPETRHELRVGMDIDSFNYTDTAQAQFLSLNSRWGQPWSTFVGIGTYQRFGEVATKATGSVTLRFTARDWLTASGAGADDHGVIPHVETSFECGHGFHLSGQFVRGLEITYQQHWFWYHDAHVLTTGMNQLFYLPRAWTWSLTVNGARTGFSGSGIDWVPSGSTRLSFPLYRGLTGNLLFAVGSENFAQVDQIGRFSARTFGGGLRCRIFAGHDVSGYLASQDRSQGRMQNSFGLSYGIRF